MSAFVLLGLHVAILILLIETLRQVRGVRRLVRELVARPVAYMVDGTLAPAPAQAMSQAAFEAMERERIASANADRFKGRGV